MNKVRKIAKKYACKNACYANDSNLQYKAIADAVEYGYHQAEKDLKLTWKDIELIVNIDKDTDNEESIIGVRNNEEHYEEVLTRFNDMKIIKIPPTDDMKVEVVEGKIGQYKSVKAEEGMNREIKFRGKEVNTGEWVYGFYTQGSFINPDTGKETIRHIIHADFLYDVVPETIGQYTGLKDKNDKEIYEGDIVCKRDLTFNLQYKGVVVYNSTIGCFRIHIEEESKGTTMRMGFEASDVYNNGQCTVSVKYDYEVVGNVFNTNNY